MPPRATKRPASTPAAKKSKPPTPKSKQNDGKLDPETAVSDAVDHGSAPPEVVQTPEELALEAADVNVESEVSEVLTSSVVEVSVTEKVLQVEKSSDLISYANEADEEPEEDAEENGDEERDGVEENGGSEDADLGTEPNSVEKQTLEAEVKDTEVPEGGNDDEEENAESEDGENGNEEDVSEENEEVGEEEADPTDLIHDPLSVTKKEKDIEIFIGGLHKEAVEEDLIEVFGKFGEIKSTMIGRHPSTKKSKGFAFIRYATTEQAKSALSALENGIEVKGKQVKISPSQDDTLYLGNICKTWTKEQVLEALKGLGIEHIEDLRVPNDPDKEGKIKGFAHVEFSTHTDAVTAFQRLRKPDAIFGRDVSAKVAFSDPLHPAEELQSQVKTVYVDGIPDSWDEDKIKELCKQYGQIDGIRLSRNLKKRRRKGYGFIDFTSHESAVACVEGINNSQLKEGETKVTAALGRSSNSKGSHHNRNARGAFKVKKEGEKTKQAETPKKGNAKPQGAKNKGKAVVEEKKTPSSKSENVKGGKENKNRPGFAKGRDHEAPSERGNRKRKNLGTRNEGRGRRDRDQGNDRRPPFKKPRGRDREADGLRNQRRPPRSLSRRKDYGAGSYAAPASRSYGSGSGSKRHHSDMEPHAGFLEPSATKQRQTHHAGYQALPPPAYREPAREVHARPAAYHEPAREVHARPHVVYMEPPAGQHSRDPYEHTYRRARGYEAYDAQGSSAATYAGGSAHLASYPPQTYAPYTGYEPPRSTGAYYPSSSSGAYPPPPRHSYY